MRAPHPAQHVPQGLAPGGQGIHVTAPSTRTLLRCFALTAVVTLGVLVAWLLLVKWAVLGLTGVALAVPMCGAAMLVGLWLGVGRGRWSWRGLGFVPARRSLWHLLWEVPLVVTACALVAMGAGSALGIGGPSRSAGTTDVEGLGPVVAVAVLVAAVAVVPLAEEVLFRGLLFAWLTQRLRPPLAIVACGVLFGMAHVAPAVMVYVVPLGIALTILRWWHGTVWASLVGHATNNLLVSGTLLAALG